MKNADDRVRENLRKLLENPHKSLDRVDRLSGISKSTLSRILAGKISPRVVTLQRLADYFKIDPSYFLKP
jgi:transcriptional regulator with XRE-family HTH domain